MTPSVKAHFLMYVNTGRKLDIGNAEPCDECEGYGYTQFGGEPIICTECNGDGKAKP